MVYDRRVSHTPTPMWINFPHISVQIGVSLTNGILVIGFLKYFRVLMWFMWSAQRGTNEFCIMFCCEFDLNSFARLWWKDTGKFHRNKSNVRTKLNQEKWALRMQTEHTSNRFRKKFNIHLKHTHCIQSWRMWPNRLWISDHHQNENIRKTAKRVLA